uniref:Uncharacterized protein n=1 Tax=Clastoptera arizonana TaxID=38151 RepID=A0A1B6CQF7_9HEMI
MWITIATPRAKMVPSQNIKTTPTNKYLENNHTAKQNRKYWQSNGVSKLQIAGSPSAVTHPFVKSVLLSAGNHRDASTCLSTNRVHYGSHLLLINITSLIYFHLYFPSSIL